MKKLFSKLHFKIAGSIVVLGGALALWFNFQKQPEMKPSLDAGVNQDTLIHIAGDSIRTDSAK